MKILSTTHAVRARSQKVVMALSTIGRCAIIQLLLSLGTSPPPAAANQSFRGSIRHHTNGCAYFTTRSSCPTGTGECTWHPQNGCTSAMATVLMTEARMKLQKSPDNSKAYTKAIKQTYYTNADKQTYYTKSRQTNLLLHECRQTNLQLH